MKSFLSLPLKSRVKPLFYLSARSFKSFRLENFNFRDHRWKGGVEPSAYTPQFSLSEEEKIANDKLPLNERILDFSKYMFHKGELKKTIGLRQYDVEPFPRLKIMMLCNIINDLLNEFDNSFIYKMISRETVKYIMEVVDEYESIPEIESALVNFENVEFLIEKLHDEITLLRHLLRNDLYKELDKPNSEEEFGGLFASAAFNDQGPTTAGEFNTHMKHEKPEKSKSIYDF